MDEFDLSAHNSKNQSQLDWKLFISRAAWREKTSAKKILKQLKVTLLSGLHTAN